MYVITSKSGARLTPELDDVDLDMQRRGDCSIYEIDHGNYLYNYGQIYGGNQLGVTPLYLVDSLDGNSYCTPNYLASPNSIVCFFDIDGTFKSIIPDLENEWITDPRKWNEADS